MSRKFVTDAELAEMVDRAVEAKLARGWNPPDDPETYGSNSIAAQVKRDQEEGDLDGTEPVATGKPGSES